MKLQRQPPIFGVLNIHKPAGMASRKVVDHVAWLVKPAQAQPLFKGFIEAAWERY